MPHISWTEIKNFHNLRRSFQIDSSSLSSETIAYKAKVKLHGTNAAIRIQDGIVTAQSRERDLSITSDNDGFARWLEPHKETFLKFSKYFSGENNTVIVHAEWAGSGIQKGVAISQIGKKILAVFAIQVISEGKNCLYVNPAVISSILPSITDVHVIPWYDGGKIYEVSIVGESEKVSKQIEEINNDVSKVENNDPFVKSIFGIDGVGEGLVLYPIYKSCCENNYDAITSHMFKAKGEKHQTVTYSHD